MPILGTVASSKLSVVAGAFESIATVNVTTDTADVTFSSIPATFKHLQIRGIAKDNRNAVYDNIVLQFNSNTTTTDYTSHFTQSPGSGSITTSENYVQNIASAGVGNLLADGAVNTNIFGPFIIDIFDYTSSKLKVVRSIGGPTNNNSSGAVGVIGGLFNSTNAISSIRIDGFNGPTIKQYTHIALYGIKGA